MNVTPKKLRPLFQVTRILKTLLDRVRDIDCCNGLGGVVRGRASGPDQAVSGWDFYRKRPSIDDMDTSIFGGHIPRPRYHWIRRSVYELVGWKQDGFRFARADV